VAQTSLALARSVVTGVVTTDAEQLVAAIRALDATADAVLTLSEPHLRAVTEAATRLGVPGEDPAAAALLRDKYQVRQRLAQAGVPQPRFGHASSVAQALAVANEIGYPVVAKPVDGSGSINVGIAAGPAELAEMARTIVEYESYGRSVTSRRTILVEEYVPGPVVSCEVLTTDGRHELYGCTNRILSEPPWAVELGGCFPAELAEQAAVFEVCKAALRAVELRRSISHTEIVLGPRGPLIIEINGRLVGGYIPEMMSLVLDRSIYLDLIELSLGRPVDRPRARRVACIRAVIAPANGLLRKLNVSVLENNPGVAALVLDRHPGDAVRLPRTNRDRLGFVVVVADSQASAIACADALLREIVIDVEPAVSPPTFTKGVHA
ncbi:MAG: ATP-grasp domain-containing protein, partial [Pseudonocardiaceae bacterium]